MRPSPLPDAMPVLSRGRHRTPKRGACFMELASVLAGEPWSDHPSCTHPLLGQLARQVNDLTTDAGRQHLATLIPSVVGRHGVGLTSFRLSVTVATRQLLELPESTQRVLSAGLFRAEQICPDEAIRDQARDALALVPGALAWVESIARDRIDAHTYAARCAPTMVRCSVEGVVLNAAPGAEADRRLRDLLEVGIATCPVSATPAPPPAPPRRTPLRGLARSRGR
ncbi:MAG: hypothetical protein WBP61_13720 [Nocardioides sp.]